MKIITLQLGDNKIELHNSFWGKETVKVNNQVVSSHYSFIGSGHKFDITENGEEVSYEAKFRLGFGVAFDLYRNGDVVLESPKYGFWRLVLTLSLIVLFIKLMERYL